MNLSVKQLANIIEHRYGDPTAFIKNLRLWLNKAGVTQTHLSAVSGFDVGNVNRWMRGHVRPSLKNMLLLDEALERIIEEKEKEVSDV